MYELRQGAVAGDAALREAAKLRHLLLNGSPPPPPPSLCSGFSTDDAKNDSGGGGGGGGAGGGGGGDGGGDLEGGAEGGGTGLVELMEGLRRRVESAERESVSARESLHVARCLVG